MTNMIAMSFAGCGGDALELAEADVAARDDARDTRLRRRGSRSRSQRGRLSGCVACEVDMDQPAARVLTIPMIRSVGRPLAEGADSLSPLTRWAYTCLRRQGDP